MGVQHILTPRWGGSFQVDGSYDCLRVESDGAGANPQLGCILYLLHGLSSWSLPCRRGR